MRAVVNSKFVFGDARLYRSDVGAVERMYFKLFGLADPAHYIRSEYFKRFTCHLSPAAVLDLGCGAGDYSFYMAARFPAARVVGIDGNISLIERNMRTRDRMQLANLSFKVGDIRSFQENDTYDLIMCVESLQYVELPELVILNSAAALKHNGHLFLHVPLRRTRQVPLHRFLKDFHNDEVVASKTKEEIISAISDAKLAVEIDRQTFGYYAGELACSMFCLFYDKTLVNQLLQGLVSPFTRTLGWFELSKSWSEGFALAILAKKTS